MIYLNCRRKEQLDKNSFWNWFHKEFQNSTFNTPNILKPNDILLTEAALGFFPIEGKQIALCNDFYLSLKNYYNIDQWNNIFDKINECARYATYRIVINEALVKEYSNFGTVDIIPEGVDIDIFKPLNDKNNLRKKYNISENKKVGIWIGTTDPSSGFSKVMEYSAIHPDIEWILIWKSEKESLNIKNCHNFVDISENIINELLNLSDFFLSTNSFYLYSNDEWKVMASNIPFVIYGNVKKEFDISDQPRNDVLKFGCDRYSVKDKWIRFLEENGVIW